MNEDINQYIVEKLNSSLLHKFKKYEKLANNYFSFQNDNICQNLGLFCCCQADNCNNNWGNFSIYGFHHHIHQPHPGIWHYILSPFRLRIIENTFRLYFSSSDWEH